MANCVTFFQLSDEEISGYEQEFAQSKKELEAFCHLRYCLSPVLEAIITLDKISYLTEQVFLVLHNRRGP